MIKQSELQFERDSNSVTGFSSANRASTDALNALQKWKCKQIETRDYVVTQDGDDILRATLSYDSDDAATGDDLDLYCGDCGVLRRKPV